MKLLTQKAKVFLVSATAMTIVLSAQSLYGSEFEKGNPLLPKAQYSQPQQTEKDSKSLDLEQIRGEKGAAGYTFVHVKNAKIAIIVPEDSKNANKPILIPQPYIDGCKKNFTAGILPTIGDQEVYRYFALEPLKIKPEIFNQPKKEQIEKVDGQPALPLKKIDRDDTKNDLKNEKDRAPLLSVKSEPKKPEIKSRDKTPPAPPKHKPSGETIDSKRTNQDDDLPPGLSGFEFSGAKRKQDQKIQTPPTPAVQQNEELKQEERKKDEIKQEDDLPPPSLDGFDDEILKINQEKKQKRQEVLAPEANPHAEGDEKQKPDLDKGKQEQQNMFQLMQKTFKENAKKIQEEHHAEKKNPLMDSGIWDDSTIKHQQHSNERDLNLVKDSETISANQENPEHQSKVLSPQEKEELHRNQEKQRNILKEEIAKRKKQQEGEREESDD